MKLICSITDITWKELLRRIWDAFWDQRVLDQSAKLSFFFLLSIFPLLIVLISLAGLMLQAGPEIQQALQRYLATVVPGSAMQLIDRTLQETIQSSDRGKLSLALLFALWTATGGMSAVIEGLNIAYAVRRERPWWKKRLVAIALTIVSLGLIALSLFLMIYGGPLINLAGKFLGLSAVFIWFWNFLKWLVLLALTLLAFNILYIFAPNVKITGCRWFMPGTILGVAIWLMVSFAFKLYLQFFDRYSLTYGSIGAVIILLMWFYLTGTAILVGGLMNSEIQKASGQAFADEDQPGLKGG